MSRLGFILARAATALGVVVATTALTHVALRVLRPDAFPEDDQALPVALAKFLRDVFLELDLGRAGSASNRPVTELMAQGLPADVALLAGGIAVGVLAGLAVGTLCAARPGTLATRALELLVALALVAPVFWVALMGILLFAPGVGGPLASPLFSEPGTYEPLTSDPIAWLRSLVVPWVVLGLPLAGLTARMTRASMTDVLESDFLRTATAKGLPERRVLRRHALPAAAAPVATIVGIYGASTASNALLVEQVFGVPGVLRETLRASAVGDFQLLQGLVIVSAALVVLGTFVADVVAGWLDPRVRDYASRRPR
jgi:peptide/nickel transport system permease protein